MLIGWLIAYGLVSTVRWMGDGFELDRRFASNHDENDNARSRPGGPAMSRILKTLHSAAVTLLAASAGFMVTSVIAFNTEFRPWADGLGSTYLWNFALAIALYALLAVLLVGKGIAGLIASRRRVQP